MWFAAFGLAPLVIGVLTLRRNDAPPQVRPGALPVLLLGLVVAGAGLWSAQPPPDQPDFTVAVFRPGSDPDNVFQAMAATDARLAWTDPDMAVVVLSMDPRRRWSLYRHGAVLVTGAGAPAGCFSWSRVWT